MRASIVFHRPQQQQQRQGKTNDIKKEQKLQ